MTDKLCRICGTEPRYVSPSGIRTSYCRLCQAAKSRDFNARRRQAKPPKPARPDGLTIAQRLADGDRQKAERSRAAKLASGRHLVADLSYAEGFTVCSCGERFEDSDPERLAQLFNSHSIVSNGRRYVPVALR